MKKKQICITLDFLRVPGYDIFGPEAIKALRNKLGSPTMSSVTDKRKVRQKLEEMLAAGQYQSKRRLAKAIGLSISYVCSIMKKRE